MNILPKKSWHVFSKENTARVWRDEAKANAEKKEKERRKILAEQEARTELLRQRKRDEANSELVEHGYPVSGISFEKGHINFFGDVEDSKAASGSNEEHEKELRKNQEDWEKKVGILKGLDGAELGEDGQKPWYVRPNHRISKKSNSSSNIFDELDKKRKCFYDPIHTIPKNYLANVSKRTSMGSVKTPTVPRTKTVEELRAERLEREREERMKVELLIARKKGLVPTEKEEMDNKRRRKEAAVEINDRKRKYNSQYNPEIARQRHKNEDDYTPFDIGRSTIRW